MLKIFIATNTLDKFTIPYVFTQNKNEADLIVVGGKPIDLEEFPVLKGIFKTGVGIRLCLRAGHPISPPAALSADRNI